MSSKKMDWCTPQDFFDELNAEFGFVLDAAATEKTKKANTAFHQRQRKGVNTFLGTKFSESDMELIYTYLGNGCHADLCEQFIESGYDMQLLIDYSNKRDTRLTNNNNKSKI